MTFEEAMAAAARIAADAATTTMRHYRVGCLTDEDDITPDLLATIRTSLTGQIGGLTWTASVARHRAGTGAEEAQTGADILIHVTLDTPTEKYSKGVLVQAKRFTSDELMSHREQTNLHEQCRKMLERTLSAFVFNNSTMLRDRCALARLVPLHSDFDWLRRRWLQCGQESTVDQDGDAPRRPCAA